MSNKITLDYYENGYCQLHAKIAEEGKYKGIPLVAIDVMDFDPENLPDVTKLNWHTVSDPDGFAEPCSPIKQEFIQTLSW